MRVLFLKKEPREKIRLFLMAASGVRLNIFLKNRKLIFSMKSLWYQKKITLLNLIVYGQLG